MRFAYLLLPLVVQGCDPCAGPHYLNIDFVQHGALPDGTPTEESQAGLWGARVDMKTSDELQIIFRKDASLPADVLELYAADTRVMFSGVDQFVPTNTEGCAHNERHYALSALAPGEYTLVHRRKNGTGDPLNCLDLDCPWTTFDGDQAVTLTLAVQ